MTRSASGPIDQLFNEYGPKGQWTELAAALDRLNRGNLKGPDLENWYHARGIVEYRTNQHARARAVFEEGLAHFPDSGWLNYGLGQEYEWLGRAEDMAACFKRVRLGDVGSATVLAIARYHYLWDQVALGQQAIQPIFDIYYQLKIVDETFVYIRGLPMFSVAFGHRATFAYLSGQMDAARSELARARSELLDYDFEAHQLDLEATATGDWQPVIDKLDATINSLDARLPTGSLRMKRAVLMSRRALTVEAAVAELDRCRLSTDDHAWLADIRTLARAEACHRLGDTDGEQAALSQFWPKQGMLFEPNHCFNFGFIAYQERLKPEYRARRRG